VSGPHRYLIPNRNFEDSPLLRLILGPDLEVDVMGGKLRLLLLEVYEEGIAITWRLSSLPTPELHDSDEDRGYRWRFSALPFVVADDRGGQYQRESASASPGRHHAYGRLCFGTPISDHAKRLDVSLESKVLSFDLTLIGESKGKVS
jgi:hypothetical protein